MKAAAFVLTWISILAAIGSGIFWIKSAQISTPLPIAWLDYPPESVVDANKKQGRFNGIAAWLAALTAFAQATGTALSYFSN